MIVYKLKCSFDHFFESWFRNSEAYEAQVKHELVSCPFCDSTQISKAPMAPRLSFSGYLNSKKEYVKDSNGPQNKDTSANQQQNPLANEENFSTFPTGAIKMVTESPTTPPFSSERARLPTHIGNAKKHVPSDVPPANKVRKTLSELKRLVEKTCDNVGDNFPEEARKIHYGETKKRNIHGKATLKELVDLKQEGIEVSPLPLFPREDA
ncbi:MAG: DUF1178 family protein [Alphaproteobacteria bacterium]|nr:DUF1178 family protein [Alphaproteobacteria bacterium]MBT5390502.1 DUF1178 family protein [Alphaproteobacteria bacterium]MBT5540606.1 DUF1178 family protein [Alphaproteobacteria bacterium]MBT5654842.1 DUF1178 family protein [Alphaproteobacteria bacterium]